MKKSIMLILSLVLGRSLMAQSESVHINFEVDGAAVSIQSGSVKFITGKDTVSEKIADKKISIPRALLKKRATVIFFIDKYSLRFDSIPVTINDLSSGWTVGIDQKPFDKKKFTMIKSWKKVEIVYYLKNDDGRTFTVDNGKRATVVH